MAKYYLGLDNGGSKTKAAIYDKGGNEIAVSGVPANPEIRKGGIVERDMNLLWEANAQVIRDVIQKSGIDAKDIASVATTGHGNGVYFIREDGTPAAPGIISTDTRAADIVREWVSKGILTKIIPYTKQTLWAGQPVAIIAWFKKHQPEILKTVRWALGCKDYVRYCLTGEPFAEITDASAISAMNLDTKEYDKSILADLGIAEYSHIFPPVKLSQEICGYITRKCAQETGLIEGTPVAGGLFDVASCCLSTGVTTTEKISAVAGTWSMNSMISKKAVYSEDLFMTSLFCMDDYYMAIEGSMTSAGNLEWFINSFLKNEEGKRMEGAYKYCDMAVESLGPTDSSIIFLPFLYGTNVNADARAAFIGIDGSQGKAHMIRAIFEGAVFSTKMHIERLLKFMEPPKTVRIAGGATESKTWVQIFADVLQMPIEVSAAKELGTLGAAMCAAVAAGDYPDMKTAADNMSRVSYVCQPNEMNRKIYRAKYEIYKALIEGIDPVWKMWKQQ